MSVRTLGHAYRKWISRSGAVLLVSGLWACSASDSSQGLAYNTEISTLDQKLYEEDRTLNSSALRLNLTYSYLLYQKLREEGQEAEARKLLDSMAKKDPASSHLQMLLSQEALQSGHIAKAEEHAHRALSLSPKDPELRFEYASILASADKFSEAMAVFEKLLAEEPDNENYLDAILNIDIRRADYWLALKRLKTALEKTDRPEYIRYRMGRIYRDMGDLKKARAEFERALSIDSTYHQAATYLAIVCEELGDEARALELFEQLAHSTNNALYHRKLASLYMKKKNFEKAAEAFHNLLQIEPADMESLFQMARVWLELGDLKKSEKNFRDLIRLDPSNGVLRLMMGMLLEAQSRTEEALDQYLKIHQDSTAYYDSMSLRFKAFYKLDKKQQLLEHLEKALNFAGSVQDASKSQALYKVIADYYSELGYMERSEQVLEKGLGRFPTSEVLLYKKGVVLEKQKRSKEGIKVMLSILSLNPNHAGALNFVGYTWADNNENLEEAERFIRRALELEPQDPFILDSLGWVQFRLGHYEEAYKNLLAAHQAVPKEFVIVDHLADTLVKLGRLSEAREYYVKALQLKPEKEGDLQKVQAKLEKIEGQLPLESRLGRLDPFCEGVVNRRCSSLRMRLEAQERERSPAAQTK
jgi:tetratricopeptide (TPR) repeat protein